MTDSLTKEWIRQRVATNQYLLTLHADEERRSEGLEITDLETVLQTGVILEEYPNDPRGASCLVYGESEGIPVHVVCGRNRSGWLVIITVYSPEPPKWESPTRRRGGKR
ncbi:MAG: DUF4258 domain-containing protein [Candidatus Methylomirabilales bacterium]